MERLPYEFDVFYTVAIVAGLTAVAGWVVFLVPWLVKKAGDG